MKTNDLIQTVKAFSEAVPLQKLSTFTDGLPKQSAKMPVLFTSHGSPMDIPRTREERPFWQSLHDLGVGLQTQYEIKAALVVSAHWLTRGTFVNIAPEQAQIYDYYGFPEEYYQVKYKATGSPDIAAEVKRAVPSVTETTDWGLDHGAWPMLMHLFPNANIPVFQLSLDYHASPRYHFELGRQLQSLRDKGVLIIGSGSLIHNLRLAGQKMRTGDMTPYGWEAEYDGWLKEQIQNRDFEKVIQYESSHALGKWAAPTPDHYVPVLYSLGLMEPGDNLSYFYEGATSLPAFSETSFIVNR